MPRRPRHAPGGLIYHVLNRGAGRQDIFDGDGDFAAFIRVLSEVLTLVPIRVLGYCVMSNHWHLVLWPAADRQLARFMQRLTITHVRRWVEYRRRVGWGSVYQGRYKSFAVQDDAHLSTVVRYVECNPVRAGIKRRAEGWRWSSLGQVHHPPSPDVPLIPLTELPGGRRKDWVEWVNRPQTAREELALQRSLRHDRPFGDETWTARTERRLGMVPLRPRGRPKGTSKKESRRQK